MRREITYTFKNYRVKNIDATLYEGIDTAISYIVFRVERGASSKEKSQ